MGTTSFPSIPPLGLHSYLLSYDIFPLDSPSQASFLSSLSRHLSPRFPLSGFIPIFSLTTSFPSIPPLGLHSYLLSYDIFPLDSPSRASFLSSLLRHLSPRFPLSGFIPIFSLTTSFPSIPLSGFIPIFSLTTSFPSIPPLGLHS